METVRRSSADLDGSGLASRVRGRGRGRAHLPHEDIVASNPGLSSASKSERYSYMHHDDRFSDDAVQNGEENRSSRQSNSEHDKKQASDKENSCSPRPQRSRRHNFDNGVMSRINTILRVGNNERSDASATQSLDRKTKESSPSSDKSGRGSPNLRLHIPPNTTSAAQFASMIRKQIAAGERPRSMTDPTSSGTASETERKQTDVKAAEIVSDDASSSHPQTKSSGSHTSSSALVKAKGRGRARGRARSRQADVDLAPAPGGSVNSQGHLVEYHSENMDQEQFVDANTTSSVLDSDAFTSECIPEDSQSSSRAASDMVGDASEDTETPFQNNGVDITSSEVDKQHETAKNLCLKIDVGGTNPAGDMCSPGQVDDITQLLSPDHEYTLDWAAAMETPTPDTSFESPPDWSIREEDGY
ncbi:uncharacterized protein [Littorina saxatilis]|uniref:Uncharacterized protein n=1 Tax=Littorina saxatilis TaxID=31220 RepID=A0AAN9BHQ1_9CAEN